MRIFLILAFVFTSRAYAYPEFIGYGYASCLTCHFNGMGSGPLNDYGRALFSAEIASRQFYPAKMSDEDIAAQSGFAGSVEMPSWLRPHLKYREVNLRRKYQSNSQVSKYYRMQQDIGFSLMDESQNYVGVFTWGNVISSGENKQRLLLREGYLRWQPVPSWWVYLGLHERVFGLRNIDHESFQRRPLGLRQTRNETAGHANSAGITVQKINDEWEFALSGFAGNPMTRKSLDTRASVGRASSKLARKSDWALLI